MNAVEMQLLQEPKQLGDAAGCGEAVTLARAIARREVSPVEVVDDCLQRIEALDKRLNAFCLLLPEQARSAAVEAEQRLYRGGSLGPLHGIPFAVKDMTATAGVPTTLGSRGVAAAGYQPSEDAVVVERLRAAGGIMIGKTTTPELGNKATCDSLLFGRTNNPWDPSRTSGGSSGGSAVAVATGMVPLAEGSDGAGSVRIPASCCGVVGLKPSLGRVPTYPMVSPFESMVTHGPLTRSVADCALMLDVMAGPDERDALSLPAPGGSFTAALEAAHVDDVRIAYSPTLGFAPVEKPVLGAVDAAARVFAELGASVEQVDPDWGDPSAVEDVMWATLMGLAAKDFCLLLESEEDMDPHLRELMVKGEGVSAFDFYRAAYVHRGLLYQSLRAVFDRYDLLIAPTLAVEPFRHPDGQAPGPDSVASRPVSPFAGWTLTYPFNLTGHPAISVPCGHSSAGLPIGLQIVGRRGADAAVLRAAKAFERARPWPRWTPAYGLASSRNGSSR
jgi:Asp-tRNA(Asn)/Glu-tRNA(Gln) amidotransferase A subunit family amidase